MGRSTKLQQVKGKLVSKKSRTQDPQCSQAMSTWKTTGMTPAVASILGKCRAKARMKNQANAQRGAGNEAKAQVLDKRAERGLTVKDRLARAKELVAQRRASAAKVAPSVQATAKPSLMEQAAAKRASGFDRKKAAQALSREGTGIVDAVARGKERKITGLIDRAAEVIVKREPKFSMSRAKAIAGARISDIFTHQAKKMEAKTRTTDFSTSAGKRFERKYDKAFAGDKRASISDIVVSHTGTRTLGLDTGRNTSTRLTNEEKAAYALKPKFASAAAFYDARAAARAKPATLQNPRAARLERLGAKTNEAKGVLAYTRVKRAEEIRTQRQQAAKPSLLAQASAKRAAKGDRTTRLNSLANKAMSKAEKFGSKANSLTGAAEDRAVNRMNAFQDRYYALTSPPKATPVRKSLLEQAAAKRASKGPREQRIAKVQQRLATGFEKRFDRAFANSKGANDNQVTLADIREKVGGKRYGGGAFDTHVKKLWQSGKVSLEGSEGIHRISDRERAGGVKAGDIKVYASYRDENSLLNKRLKRKRA